MGIFDWLFGPKKEKSVKENIEDIKRWQTNIEGNDFNISLFEKIPFDYILGVFINQKGKKSTLMPIKENIINFSAPTTIETIPKDYMTIEEKIPYLVIIWGVETPDELMKKVFSQKTLENKKFVMMLIYVTMNTSRPQELRETFSLIEKFNKKLWQDLSHITVPVKYPNRDFSSWR